MRRLVCRGLSTALALLLLAGCDGLYALRIENHSAKPIAVGSSDFGDFSLEPCTGKVILNELGDPFSPSYDVTVRDASDQVLAHRTISIPAKQVRKGKRWLAYQYGLGSGACPAPVEDHYGVVVHNDSGRRLDVTLAGRRLGMLAPGESVSMLRPGTIGEAREIFPVVRDETGAKLSRTPHLSTSRIVPDYRIGDPPVLHFWLR